MTTDTLDIFDKHGAIRTDFTAAEVEEVAQVS